MPGLLRASCLLLILSLGAPAWSQPPPPDSGLEAHFTRQDDPGQELVFACCRGIQPPAGIYHVWLEGAWRMTPFSLQIGSSGTGPVGPAPLLSLPTVEAGRVTLPPAEGRSVDLDLHLLHAGSYLEGGFPRWEIVRRRAVEQVGEGVLLPAGRAIGALWDRKVKRYVALSRPFEVRGGQTVQIPLRRPKGVAHLIVQLQRQAVASTARGLGVELGLKQRREERPPDLTVLTADRVHAVWYGLEPGPAELRARSGQTFLGPELIDLLPGRIEHLAGELKPRPSLEVALDLPAVLRQGELLLVVRRSPTGEILAEQTLKPDALEHRFEGLPPTRLEVDLVVDSRIGPGSFTRSVDLGSGADGFLLLDPELITLRGTVERGGQGSPAELIFETVTRTRLEARADADGAYEAVLVDPVRSVAVLLEGAREPYLEIFSPEIAESRELDIHLPKGDLRARVVDAVTGEGIPGVAVSLLHGDVATVGYSLDLPTDETGTVQLPLLRPGTLEIHASAEGYSQRRPVQAKVDGRTDQVFEVRLEPFGEKVALRLLLPSGAPAAGAELLLLDSLETELSLASLRADGEGMAEAPRHAGLLLIKHRAAGFLVRPWRPREGEVEMEWSLPAPADLTVRARDASGRNAAAQTGLTLWVEGHRLSGPALSWLTGTDFQTDASGLWVGRNLPQSPVEVLAWVRSAGERARKGKLDALATGVPYPWPKVVEVRAVE